MEEELIGLVGPPGTPLPLIRDKASKGRIADLLLSAVSPDVKLRAYLCLKRVPPRVLLKQETVESALQPQDCVPLLPYLSQRITTLEAQAVLGVVSKGLVSRRITITPKWVSSLLRTARKWYADRARAFPSERTLAEFFHLVEATCKNADSLTRGKRRSQSKQPSLEILLRLSALLASGSPARVPKLAAAEMLFAAHKSRVVMLDAASLDQEFDLAVESVLECALDEMERLASSGDLPSFEVLVSKLLEAEPLRKKARERLQKLHDQAARYSVAVQEAMSRLLGLETEQRLPSLTISADDPEAIHATQLASALVRAWAAREEGPKSRESFGELQAVLAGFFGIVLRDSVGETESYNSRIHEPAPGRKPGPKVRVLRPWVEMTRHGTSEVLIKALVEPVE